MKVLLLNGSANKNATLLLHFLKLTSNWRRMV